MRCEWQISAAAELVADKTQYIFQWLQVAAPARFCGPRALYHFEGAMKAQHLLWRLTVFEPPLWFGDAGGG